MTDKRYILFDMDGTLVNTYPGISKTIKTILDQRGIEHNPNDYRKCLGPPLVWSFENVFGADRQLAEQLVADYRSLYVPMGFIYDAFPYDGMVDTIKTLYAHGKKLMVASSKPQYMCELVLDHFGLSDYFCFVSGVMVSEDGVHSIDGRTTKTDTIRYALTENSITDIEHAIMIGDRGSDMSSAVSLGIDCIGVTFGFGSKEELLSAGANATVDSPAGLIDLLV